VDLGWPAAAGADRRGRVVPDFSDDGAGGREVGAVATGRALGGVAAGGAGVGAGAAAGGRGAGVAA
jgi:hypothetical protein